jgi:hypothetical protein
MDVYEASEGGGGGGAQHGVRAGLLSRSLPENALLAAFLAATFTGAALVFLHPCGCSGPAASRWSRSSSSAPVSPLCGSGVIWPLRRPTRRRPSDSYADPLHPPAAHSGDLEARLQPCRLRMGGQPGLGSPSHAPLLLRPDHLERIAVPRAALALHLDKDERPAAAHDQVELVAARPHVAAEDAVAAQEIVERREVLARYAAATAVSTSMSA